MEEVYGIDVGELMGSLDQLKGAITMIHGTRMVTDDVSINNAMRDGEDIYWTLISGFFRLRSHGNHCFV